MNIQTLMGSETRYMKKSGYWCIFYIYISGKSIDNVVNQHAILGEVVCVYPSRPPEKLGNSAKFPDLGIYVSRKCIGNILLCDFLRSH